MGSFDWNKELTLKIRPNQPLYQTLRELCLEMGFKHPTPLIAVLIQRAASQEMSTKFEKSIE